MIPEEIDLVICKRYEFTRSMFIIYTQQQQKVDTFSTLIISYTNSIDGKCYIS